MLFHFYSYCITKIAQKSIFRHIFYFFVHCQWRRSCECKLVKSRGKFSCWMGINGFIIIMMRDGMEWDGMTWHEQLDWMIDCMRWDWIWSSIVDRIARWDEWRGLIDPWDSCEVCDSDCWAFRNADDHKNTIIFSTTSIIILSYVIYFVL